MELISSFVYTVVICPTSIFRWWPIKRRTADYHSNDSTAVMITEWMDAKVTSMMMPIHHICICSATGLLIWYIVMDLAWCLFYWLHLTTGIHLYRDTEAEPAACVVAPSSSLAALLFQMMSNMNIYANMLLWACIRPRLDEVALRACDVAQVQPNTHMMSPRWGQWDAKSQGSHPWKHHHRSLHVPPLCS